MSRSRTAVGIGAAALLLSTVLPWVRWGRGGNSAALVDAERIELAVFVGGDLVSRTVLRPAYLLAVVGAALAALGLFALRRWDRRSLVAVALAGSPALAVTAASLRRLTATGPVLIETSLARVPTAEVAPGIGLLLALLGALLVVGAGAVGLLAGAIPRERRARVRARLPDRLDDASGLTLLHALLALAIAATLWYHVQFLGLAIGRDAGAYLTVAAGVLSGKLPYVHFFDHKPPGIYYYLAAVLGAGGSVHTAREGILLVNAGVAALLVDLGRRLWDPTAGLVAAFGYLVAAPLYQGYMLQTEQFVALFSLAAMWVALRYRRDPRRERPALALAGALAGVATLFKHPGLATLGALGLFVLAVPTGTESAVRSRIEALAALCGGFALPIILVTAYFALLGGLGPFLRWVVLLNVGYLGSSTFSPAANLADQHATMMTVWPVWVLAAAGLVLVLGDWAASERPDPGQVLVVAAAVSALAIILVRPWPHYLLHPLPLAALLAGYAVYVVADDLPGDPQRAKTALVVGLVLSAGVAVPHLEEQRARNDGLAQQRAIAADVESHLGPGNSLLVFPASPLYYYLTGTEPYDENVYYLRSNRGVSYTQTGVVELVTRRPPDLVLVRDWECDALPAACSHLKSNYERVEGYDRSLTLYRANGTADG
jgi:hypothetical protein